jgi:hypothetical protein
MKVKYVAIIAVALSFSACKSVPSFYDDNESLLASNVVYSVELVDCNKPPISFRAVERQSDRLRTYAELKGSSDVVELVDIFDYSLDPVLKRESMTTNFCKLKKETLLKQSTSMSKAIMGRYK